MDVLYRIYTVNKLGTFIGSQEVNRASDAEAIEFATRVVGRHDLEVWRGGRKLIKIDHASKGLHSAEPM